VGAGIAINAGLSAHGRREIGDVLIDVELMDEQGNISTEKADELALSYRSSNIPNRNLFVLSARFKATYKASAEDIREKTVEHLKERRRKQPLSKPTAGSTFKQPYGGKSAGWYIDQAGLKGYSVGGAKISEKHANWIENFDNASCDHVKKLIEIVIAKVEKDFGIILEQEVSLLS
jgi:UDP-N-acetylmuramate dehydrogenase